MIHPKSRGIGLIEMIVVICIIVVLTAMAFANYRKGQQQLALDRTAYKLAQDIRRAQEMAMAAKECSACGGGVPSGGYGIYLEQGDEFYLLYADNGNGQYGAGDTQIGDDINLERGIYISGLLPSEASISFEPPDPVTVIKDGDGLDAEEATITIALEKDSTRTKRVIVNKAGLIYVE